MSHLQSACLFKHGDFGNVANCSTQHVYRVQGRPQSNLHRPRTKPARTLQSHIKSDLCLSRLKGQLRAALEECDEQPAHKPTLLQGPQDPQTCCQQNGSAAQSNCANTQALCHMLGTLQAPEVRLTARCCSITMNTMNTNH